MAKEKLTPEREAELMAEYRRLVEARVAEEGTADLALDASPSIPDSFVELCLDNAELGDGVLYAALHRGKYVFVDQGGQWLYWTGQHWEWDSANARRAMIAVEDVADLYQKMADSYRQKIKDEKDTASKERAAWLAKRADAFQRRATRLRTQGGRRACLDFAQSNRACSLALRGDELDRDPWALPVANGVIDLKSGAFRKGRPGDYLLRHSSVEWQGYDAPCPEWKKFLLEIMDGDQEMVDYLQRVFGYALTGLTDEHIFLVLCGRGRNGKSVLMEVLQKVLSGERASSSLAAPIPSEMLLDQGKQKSASGPTPDIMVLPGLRIAVASETDEGQKFSASRVKWLSGGDTLTGRSPYGKELIAFEPSHLLCLLTNNKPHAPARDYAFWERIQLVEFPLSFVDRDPQNASERRMDKGLKKRLLAELPGILAWLVDGCLYWQRDGLNPPLKVRDAVATYRRDEDVLADFIEDCCELLPDDDKIRTSATEIYDAFCEWFRVNISAKKTMPQKAFGKLLAEKCPRIKYGGKNYYQGIRLLPEYQPDQQGGLDV